MLVNLDPGGGTPLYRQVYEALQRVIVNGELKQGQGLPPTRQLASQLAVSRNTVNAAYSQLCAEGYITGRQGSGYFVSAPLPDTVSTSDLTRRAEQTPRPPPFSSRGQYLARPTRPVPRIQNPAFQPGLPDLQAFPFHHWRRCLGQVSRRSETGLYKYSDQGGYRPLKLALQTHLSHARGVNCHADQIVIVNGSQAGLDLIARLLIDSGDVIAVEEPGYLGARDGFLAAGAELEPIPVDNDGLLVERLGKSRKPVRLVYTTPSYQFPLGVTLSLPRRLALLEWADQHNGFIIEDDYDSEFRFRDRPLACLQGLDRSGRVIYFGTFSKVMFPGLRIGYLVVPESLAGGFAAALRKTGQDPSPLLQATLAEFIERGFFAGHIRRMRKLYGEKQRQFVALARAHLEPWLEVKETGAGMQVPAFFRRTFNVVSLVEQARQIDLTLTPLSNYYLGTIDQPGLYLGYAGVPFDEMERNILKLRGILQAAVH